MKPRNQRALRCAIYTRKSSEEGLEQDFNSLHAQRWACEAYIRSQQGEGWRLRKTSYNDGGLSGATMERPALKQLLADIEEGLIDVVVVYKVGRLTRSLSDFARMVEISLHQAARDVVSIPTIALDGVTRCQPSTGFIEQLTDQRTTRRLRWGV